MNETIFFLHAAIIFLCTLGALKLGKEALKTWVCLSALLANFFVLKQIVLFNLQVTSSDVFAVGSIFGLNLLQEYHGRESAAKAGKLCFYCLIAFALFSQIHLLYIPSPEDFTALAYAQILAPAPRLLAASLFVFFIVQKLDLHLFSKLKATFIKSSLFTRNLLSISCSQLVDTILFTFIGLYGLIASPFDVIIVSFLVKIIAIACLSPATLLAKYWVTPKRTS